MANLAWVFFLLGILLDLLSLAYFLCTSRFSRLEYYVFFGFHLLITAIATVLGVLYSGNPSNNICPLGRDFIGASLFLNLVFICSAFLIMMFNLYFVLKFAHFGSNIVWTFMWAQASNCHHFLVTLVGVVHGLLSVLALISFLVMNLMGKTTLTSKCWKQFYGISIAMMIVCYLVVILAIPSSHSCSNTAMFVGTYKFYGMI